MIRLVRRPAGGDLTFGLRRAEILSAQANGATLLVLAALIVYGGSTGSSSPSRPQGLVVLLVALVGVVCESARDRAAREGEPQVA